MATKEKVENTGTVAETPKVENLETRVSYLERIVKRLKNIAEKVRGEDIDGDGKIGSVRTRLLGILAFACVLVVTVHAADVWVLFDGDATYGTAKVTTDGAGSCTLTVNKLTGALTSVTVAGDLTLASGETIDNATDSKVRVTFDDDAAVLGYLLLTSDNAHGSMADNDLFEVTAQADNDSNEVIDYATMQLKILDVTTNTEDAAFVFQVQENGSEVTVATLGIATDIGSGAETISINSSDWDISTAGVATGLGDITSDGDITFSGGDLIGSNTNEIEIGKTDGTITLARATAGTVTITAKDSDANAAVLLRAGGNAALTVGATNGTAEVSSSDWKISTTGVATDMGNITSDGTVQGEQLTSTDDALITDDLIVGDDVTATGKVTSVESAVIVGRFALLSKDATTQYVFEQGAGNVGTTNTFTTAFGAAPKVFLQTTAAITNVNMIAYPSSITASNFIISGTGAAATSWLAIGTK